ncbi:zinc-binding dehydrogenase [Aeromicrobium sp. YIM 150415]|uniref:zinc-dependent alcohol dehydrogenase n=1 Tax=Aeromicrobium sp. YIM 150415 TaxID=2803912 RepID=UPI0019637168|nr:zinc-binding dehydrogenase [Aeromicrobium sp. YIM 150415]MBM9463622.1 zinc-binding dehydrogenase [Aeromicrobium sp. YIM 150415]
MWIYRQPGPHRFERLEVDPPVPENLPDDHVLVRFAAGAICGSDLPKFAGVMDPDNPYTGLPGVPMHELVGRVEASRSDRLRPGQRVVGIVAQSKGLSELIANPAGYMIPVDDALSDAHATVVQPLSTVLSALESAPDLAGRRVSVLGLGPLGLLFGHVARRRGAARVTGVDRIDRSAEAASFGFDETVRSEVSAWSRELPDGRPDLVIDCIGHRQEVVGWAIDAVERNGHVLVFGLPEDHYVVPMRSFFRKNLTMSAGATQDWQRHLAGAQEYLLASPELADRYVTHEFALDDVEEAYWCYATPAPGRLKVVLRPPR